MAIVDEVAGSADSMALEVAVLEADSAVEVTDCMIGADVDEATKVPD